MDFSILGSLEFVLPYLKWASLLVILHNEAMMTPDHELNATGDSARKKTRINSHYSYLQTQINDSKSGEKKTLISLPGGHSV